MRLDCAEVAERRRRRRRRRRVWRINDKDKQAQRGWKWKKNKTMKREECEVSTKEMWNQRERTGGATREGLEWKERFLELKDWVMCSQVHPQQNWEILFIDQIMTRWRSSVWWGDIKTWNKQKSTLLSCWSSCYCSSKVWLLFSSYRLHLLWFIMTEELVPKTDFVVVPNSYLFTAVNGNTLYCYTCWSFSEINFFRYKLDYCYVEKHKDTDKVIQTELSTYFWPYIYIHIHIYIYIYTYTYIRTLNWNSRI